MKIYTTFASKKIRDLREEKRLTQEALADQLGISRQSIISVEKGKCLPSLPLALRIAEIFDSTLEEIFNPNKKYFERGGEKTMPRHLMPWSPFGDLDPFFEDEDFLPTRFGRRALTFPAVNVKETEKEVILTADIPGIKEDELAVEVGNDFVDISGERQQEEKIEKEDYFRQELRYGAFSRRIPLPVEVRSDKAEATVKNGQLKLVIPKVEIAKPKVTKIKILPRRQAGKKA